jgi:hypothetical protein
MQSDATSGKGRTRAVRGKAATPKTSRVFAGLPLPLDTIFATFAFSGIECFHAGRFRVFEATRFSVFAATWLPARLCCHGCATKRVNLDRVERLG